MENQGDEIDYDEDLDQIDFENYKGIFYEEPTEKYQDEVTGAHFEHFDMCKRLEQLQKSLKQNSPYKEEPPSSSIRKVPKVKLVESKEIPKEDKVSSNG